MIREVHEMASSTTASRKFRFDSFATEFASEERSGAATSFKSEKEDRPKSDICDNDSGIGE